VGFVFFCFFLSLLVGGFCGVVNCDFFFFCVFFLVVCVVFFFLQGFFCFVVGFLFPLSFKPRVYRVFPPSAPPHSLQSNCTMTKKSTMIFKVISSACSFHCFTPHALLTQDERLIPEASSPLMPPPPNVALSLSIFTNQPSQVSSSSCSCIALVVWFLFFFFFFLFFFFFSFFFWFIFGGFFLKTVRLSSLTPP